MIILYVFGYGNLSAQICGLSGMAQDDYTWIQRWEQPFLDKLR